MCTASNKRSSLGDLLILLYVGEMGRKCIQVGTKLLASTQLIVYNKLAILIAILLLSFTIKTLQ